MFEAQVDRSGAVLAGTVPDEATRAALQAQLEAAGYQGRIRNELSVRAAAPAGFAEAARGQLAQLLRLDLGTVRLTDRAGSLQGMTCRDPLRAEVENASRAALPAGFSGSAQVSLRQTGCFNCQVELDNVTRGRNILFEQGRAEVAKDAGTTSLLDDIARVLQACPTARITVEGHTNSDGSAQRNRRLSENRAREVIGALAARGAEAGRFTPVGYGPDRPLVPHGSEEARERNRRVQFVVTLN